MLDRISLILVVSTAYSQHSFFASIISWNVNPGKIVNTIAFTTEIIDLMVANIIFSLINIVLFILTQIYKIKQEKTLSKLIERVFF